MSPPKANPFMGDLKKRILRDWSFKPLIWWRYIDDIFCYGSMGKKNWKSSCLDINYWDHPSITFAFKHSWGEIDFLDVEIIKENNWLNNSFTAEILNGKLHFLCSGRTELFYRQRKEFHKDKSVFYITYYPDFLRLKNIL